MASTDAKTLIEQAVKNVQDEVHSLQQLKLVFAVELQGGRDVQMYRVEVPGPVVTKGMAGDAKVRVTVPRAFFNVMAVEGKVADWREAFAHGPAKASGPAGILKLIDTVVARHEERDRLRKQSHP